MASEKRVATGLRSVPPRTVGQMVPYVYGARSSKRTDQPLSVVPLERGRVEEKQDKRK